ncbi:lipase secreted [Fusarium coicis]|nr:lipase secreted [Fusarium coicis]
MKINLILQFAGCLFLCLSRLSCGTPIADMDNLHKRLPPLRPSDDSFYKVPDNISTFANGAIIRNRKTPNPIATMGQFPLNLANAYQILYKTMDGQDQPTATVLTVLIPHFADTRKILSYQVAEDASNINCAPSYAFQLDTDPGNNVPQSELLLIQAALEKQWIVIVPDFEGPNAAFLSNKLGGQAILDGIRAALKSGSFTGVDGDNKPTITMWGYSGGGQVSMWAAELQPIYAPELKIAGLAAGGVISKISTVLDMVNGKASAGLIAAGVHGLSHQYRDLKSILNKNIRPASLDNYTRADVQCSSTNLAYFAGAYVMAWFKDAGLILKDKRVNAIITANDLGQRAPKIPMFIYKGAEDEISPISEADALIASYCARGSIIQYERDRTANHSLMAIAGAPTALSWLEDRMEGRPNPNTACNIYTVESAWLDPQALLGLPWFILNALLGLLGKPVGIL